MSSKDIAKEKKKRNKREVHEVDPAVIAENIKKLQGGIKENKVRYDFAIRLNDLLKKKGIDQEKFAKDIDIGVGTLSNYRKGIREPNLTVLEKMADKLDVSTDYLSGKSECPNYDFDDINKKIGLSQQALEELYKFQHDITKFHEDEKVDIKRNMSISDMHKDLLKRLSQMIENSGQLYFLFDKIEQYIERKKELNKIVEKEKALKDDERSFIVSEKIKSAIEKTELMEYSIQKKFMEAINQIIEDEEKKKGRSKK